MMAKQASRLGRGLGSLITGGTQSTSQNPSPPLSDPPNLNDSLETSSNLSETTTGSEDMGSKLLQLPIDHIVPNPYQPRKTIDPESIKELAASIESEGLLQPVVVRKIVDNFQLIAGERRWRAHQFLGREKILAYVMTTSELSSASLSLIENLQREGLNPLEESMGYHSLVDEFGLTQADVAQRVGKSRSHITNMMRFLQLEEELRSFLVNRKITAGHAKVLLGISDKSIRLSIGRDAARQGWSVRRCEEEISKVQSGGERSISKRHLTDEFLPLAQKATSLLGRKVKIQSNSSGSGRITLSFESESDLKNTLEKLGVH